MAMVEIAGTYQDGYVKLDVELSTKEPIKVIVTFLEEVEISSKKRLTLADFSFIKSREALKDYKGSFSDTVVEERRRDL